MLLGHAPWAESVSTSGHAHSVDGPDADGTSSRTSQASNTTMHPTRPHHAYNSESGLCALLSRVCRALFSPPRRGAGNGQRAGWVLSVRYGAGLSGGYVISLLFFRVPHQAFACCSLDGYGILSPCQQRVWPDLQSRSWKESRGVPAKG